MSANSSVAESVDFENFVHNNRFTNEYIQDDSQKEPSLGFGAFGVVIKAKNKIDDKDYAIKMISVRARSPPEVPEQKSLNQDFIDKIRELRIWARLEMDYCVQYRSAWLETDDTSKKRFLDIFSNSLPFGQREYFLSTYKKVDFAVLHIQMDLCSMSLRKALDQMDRWFQIRQNRDLNKVAYYISAEILYEVLEAINYLHTHKPHPIIHRDVKPENLLVKFSTCGRCIKLGDFGLAVLHEAASQRHTSQSGCGKYMAPEIRRSGSYTTSADVYSIGVMSQELFNFDINRLGGVPGDLENCLAKYKNVIEMTTKAMSGLGRSRPDCAAMMAKRNEWALDISELGPELTQQLNMEYEQAQFVRQFLQTKLLYTKT